MVRRVTCKSELTSTSEKRTRNRAGAGQLLISAGSYSKIGGFEGLVACAECHFWIRTQLSHTPARSNPAGVLQHAWRETRTG
jgi:hypothetical protein